MGYASDGAPVGTPAGRDYHSFSACTGAVNMQAHNHLSPQSAFDALAPCYDALFSSAHNALMAWLRRENLALMQRLFPPGGRLLEIGCGTGEEAVALARLGYTVWATDVAPGMVEQAAKRAAAMGVRDRVHTLVVPARDVGTLGVSSFFDGAFTSFGALNCEPDVQAWVQAMFTLLRPHAPLMCSVMNRWAVWEMAWYALHGEPRQAVRRLGGGWRQARMPTAEGHALVSVRYFSEREMRRVLAPAFTVETVAAWPLLLPPPYLDALFRRWRALFARLEWLERRVRSLPFCRALGDHVLVIARRRA
ncbi:class I SAM-dependent methyltransferase [Ardenticatena maritima]|uniref:class I SAM-dependent methyltransferase n=2 Tax=Ardenticatena maritima TaxID=872965 RepID=UPI00128EBC1B|nr:class I SAM-dependent methyltransferase [Ardenticatena maritima]